mgnify:CR=1 FL=1
MYESTKEYFRGRFPPEPFYMKGLLINPSLTYPPVISTDRSAEVIFILFIVCYILYIIIFVVYRFIEKDLNHKIYLVQSENCQYFEVKRRDYNCELENDEFKFAEQIENGRNALNRLN